MCKYGQENYSPFLVEAVDQWNAGYGPFFHKLVFVPLKMVDVVLCSLIPIYNLLVWVVKVLLSDILLDSLLGSLPDLKVFGLALGSMCKHLVLEVPPYLTSTLQSCDYARNGDLCYDPGHGRVFDLITPMADVRTMAVAVSSVAVRMCGRASVLTNMALYLLMDINLAKALHNIFNAVLYLLVQVPSVTAQRCKNHGPTSPENSFLACIPDLNQPINMLVISRFRFCCTHHF